MITFIATVGGRDIKISETQNKLLLESKPDLFKPNNDPLARKLGEFLLKNYNEKNPFNNISIPIIVPALKKVFDIEGNKAEIDQMFLIVTNQSDAKFRDSDTIEYGKIIKQLLQSNEFISKNKFKIKVINKLIEINSNVNYLDVQFDFFRKILSNTGDHISATLNKSDKIYLCAQGGIDAINTGLLLNLLNKFGDKVIPLNINEGNSYVTPIKIYSRLSYNEKVKIAIKLIEKYDYNSLSEFAEFNNNFNSLSLYAASRMNFDFSSARKHLDNIDNSYATLKSQLTNEIDFKNNEKKLTIELVHNAEIKFTQGAYVDYLLRFFRIMEQIGKFCVKDYFKDLKWIEHKWDESFKKVLINNEKLNEFCKNERIDFDSGSKKVDFLVKNPNITIYTSLAKFISSETNNIDYFPYQILEKGQVLTWIRNKSIGAHNFEPVSLQIIESALAEKDEIIENLMNMIKCFFNIQVSPYKRINECLLKFMKD